MTEPIEPAPPPPLSGPTPNAVTSAPPSKPGKLRAYVVIGVIVGLLAVILYATKDNAAAKDLVVGECFDVPTSATVSTVVRHPCTEPHGAEVIAVTEYTEPGTYPISLTLERFIDTACVPVFETYVGVDYEDEPDHTIGYFYPSRDGWSEGDRTITCYVTRIDKSLMTQSIRGSAASP